MNYWPTFFKKSHDGGPNSGVTGYWLIEWKPVFSIVLLKFNKGTREAFHSHAFDAVTFWLPYSSITEHHLNKPKIKWYPSFFPKYTPKKCFHKVEAHNVSYCLSIRGPWDETWQEYDEKNNELITLTHSRKILDKMKK